MSPHLRPATAADRDLLLAIYASTREDELAVVPWDAATKRAFVEQQFTAQDSYYRSAYPDPSFDVVEVAGEPVGRLYVARFPGDTRIVDIAILPAHRGRGIGTALLSALAAEADAVSRTLSIHTETAGRARRLYERLGFVVVAPRDHLVLMERPPQLTTAS